MTGQGQEEVRLKSQAKWLRGRWAKHEAVDGLCRQAGEAEASGGWASPTEAPDMESFVETQAF